MALTTAMLTSPADQFTPIRSICDRAAFGVCRKASAMHLLEDAKSRAYEAVLAEGTPDMDESLIYTIAGRRVIDWLRTFTGHRKLGKTVPIGDLLKVLAAPETSAIVDQIPKRRKHRESGIPTRAELRAAFLVARGFTKPEIARQFGKSERTINTQIVSIRRKLGARNVVHLVTRMYECELLPQAG